jgi:ACS family hexuronate transporter-like MFS transporter
MILPTDIFPRKVVGAVAGLIGFAGAMGGVVFGQAVGYLLDHGFGWTFVFALAGSFHVIAFFVICAAIPSIQPVIADEKETLPQSAQPAATGSRS